MMIYMIEWYYGFVPAFMVTRRYRVDRAYGRPASRSPDRSGASLPSARGSTGARRSASPAGRRGRDAPDGRRAGRPAPPARGPEGRASGPFSSDVVHSPGRVLRGDLPIKDPGPHIPELLHSPGRVLRGDLGS